jgi:hypothetical protein
MLAAAVLASALAASSGAPPAPTRAITRTGEPAPEAVPVATLADVERVCAALVPEERLRAKGDAIARGEAEARHAAGRTAALEGRYSTSIPAGKLAFAPYDAGERELALAEPVTLPLAGGAARLFPTLDRALPVTAGAAEARRVLEAQRAGRLELQVVWALPDDAACGGSRRARPFTVPVEPVSWAWLDGGAEIARGGEGADRPIVTAAQGAVPHVEVGEPLAGPAEAKGLVLGRSKDLLACYATALRRDPALDGVLVADLGGEATAIRADSVGDADLAACVREALAGAGRGGARAAVPIRFELSGPAPAQTAPSADR